MKDVQLKLSGHRAEMDVLRVFQAAGWRVDREPKAGRHRADLLLRKGGKQYIAEVKAVSEGRPDRVIAHLSQAILQSQAYARELSSVEPLAVVWVPAASQALIEKVAGFSRQFAPGQAVGVISGDGAQYFEDPVLAALNARPNRARPESLSQRAEAHNLFSDLNQWMLKLLLAPELPEHLIGAPRAEYRNVSELARAADVSMMSAFRFVAGLRAEGFLDEAAGYLRLVRRSELFRRWQSYSDRSSPELRMCFLIPGSRDQRIRDLLLQHDACLGLFAAADALGLGHVSGVLPHVLAARVPRAGGPGWREVIPAAAGEQPHFLLRQALAPKSLLRAAVVRDGVRIADVLQVWLDVSANPARGAEQGALIYDRILRKVVERAS
jgi:hypothetical protein